MTRHFNKLTPKQAEGAQMTDPSLDELCERMRDQYEIEFGDALAKRNGELEKDAARYRWLRASTLRSVASPAVCFIENGLFIRTGMVNCDKLVDVALTAGKGE